MKNIAEKVLSTVIAAGIIANCSVLYSFGQRLARIETKLEIRAEKQVASNPVKP
jgi:hypothetical protein